MTDRAACAVARECVPQRVTDHWPARTVFGTDEMGFGFAVVSSLEAAEDAVGEISIGDITTIILGAAMARIFERNGVRSQFVKKTKEHVEAEKNLRGRKRSRKEGSKKKAC